MILNTVILERSPDSPTSLMFVCLCKSVTDHQIIALVGQGRAATLRDLRRELGVASGCRHCRRYASEVLDEALARALPPDAALTAGAT
jgi:bacterioferritin-associated ferredoxin